MHSTPHQPPTYAHTRQAQIEAQGETVRKLKADKADAAAVKAAVDQLLALKVGPGPNHHSMNDG